MNPNLLNNWKEIAAYLGRGLRTVQRWEEELGMPVRRIRERPRSAVSALKSELDQWMQGRSSLAKRYAEAEPSPIVQANRSIREVNRQKRKALREKRERMELLLRQLKKSLREAHAVLDILEKSGIIPPPDFAQVSPVPQSCVNRVTSVCQAAMSPLNRVLQRFNPITGSADLYISFRSSIRAIPFCTNCLQGGMLQ